MARARSRQRGSILVIVLVTILFTAAALVAFLDRASNELLVASHIKVTNRLREDAYSALNVVLGALEEFREADANELRSPIEGWGKGLQLPWLQWWIPSGIHTVDVSFVDESGKMPLMHTTTTQMLALFEAWGLSQDDSQKMVDEIMTWTHLNPNYVPTIAGVPDYEQDTNPYDPPLRTIRSYSELSAIDFVRDKLYTNGQPNDLWWRFVSDFSLLNYPTPNINSAPPDVLAAVGQFNGAQQANIAAFLAGQGDFVNPATVALLGGQWFTSGTQVLNVVGGQGNTANFSTVITALRISITVHEGLSKYELSVVVAPPGGAKTVQTTATEAQQAASSAQSGESSNTGALPGTTAQTGPKSSPTNTQASAAAAGTVNLKFPFTVLEISENDQILTQPPPPPPSPTT
jgi:general secretion pathway protein K